jgi:hypothetical protein
MEIQYEIFLREVKIFELIYPRSAHDRPVPFPTLGLAWSTVHLSVLFGGLPRI